MGENLGIKLNCSFKNKDEVFDILEKLGEVLCELPKYLILEIDEGSNGELTVSTREFVEGLVRSYYEEF